LGQDLSGWRVLDAYAGSGALGFEAASRGAAEVQLLDSDATLVASLMTSATRLGAAQMRVDRADATAWMARCAPARFDLVLLDPPFDSGTHAAALAAAQRLAAVGGFVYLESGEPLAAWPAGLLLFRAGRAGAVHSQLFRRVAFESFEPGDTLPPPTAL
jgi:16S rRNA (guanine966-N2)-methyltransferase